MNGAVHTGSTGGPGRFVPRAFLFDLDGVLWDSNRLHAAMIARTCEEAGLEMPPYARLAGLSTPAAFALVLSEGPVASAAAVAALTERKRALFQEHIQEVRSDHEALQTVLGAHRPDFLALVTGASRATADAYLRRLPTAFFDLVITAEDGLPSKPAPDAYLAAAERLGVEPSECVVFEDSAAGLAAARAAGARLAHVTFAWSEGCDGQSCQSDWCAPTAVEAIRLILGESCQR